MLDIAAIVVHQEGIFERDVAYQIPDLGFDGMREKHRAVWNTINAMIASGHLRRHMGGLYQTPKTLMLFERTYPPATPLQLKCDLCGKQCNLHSFHCSYCGGTYCGDHRLPFSHNCINEADWRKETSRPRHDDKPKRETPNLPITECVFCGVKTSKIFYCTSCGHNYCFIHKSKVDHNCEYMKANDYQKSYNSQRTVKDSKSASGNQIVVAFFVIVAIIFGAFLHSPCTVILLDQIQQTNLHLQQQIM